MFINGKFKFLVLNGLRRGIDRPTLCEKHKRKGWGTPTRRPSVASGPSGVPSLDRHWLDILGLGTRGLLRPAGKFEDIGTPMGAGAVLFAAANPAEGAAVTTGVIVSSQIIVIRQSQHGGAAVHVQGAHGVGERLILILVGQGEAVGVVHLNDGGTATGHGGFRS